MQCAWRNMATVEWLSGEIIPLQGFTGKNHMGIALPKKLKWFYETIESLGFMYRCAWRDIVTVRGVQREIKTSGFYMLKCTSPSKPLRVFSWKFKRRLDIMME